MRMRHARPHSPTMLTADVGSDALVTGNTHPPQDLRQCACKRIVSVDLRARQGVYGRPPGFHREEQLFQKKRLHAREEAAWACQRGVGS